MTTATIINRNEIGNNNSNSLYATFIKKQVTMIKTAKISNSIENTTNDEIIFTSNLFFYRTNFNPCIQCTNCRIPYLIQNTCNVL
jgi:hypothetical protein